MKTCSVGGCERPFRARKLCVYHYAIARKSGELSKVQGTPEYLILRINYSPYCWEWQGTLNKAGYGAIKPNASIGNFYLAHRWLYTYLVGDIPEGLHLDHLCRNRKCVNPMHLEPVTQEENIRRGAEARGCKKGHAFTPDNTVWEQSGTIRRCKTCRNEHRMKTKGVLAYAV